MTNLPVPIPASEVPGNFITGALWNANVFNGLTFLLNPPDFVGVQSVTQSLATTAWTSLSLDTSTLDSYGGHSNVTNNSRYVAQVAGWHTVNGVYTPGTGSSVGFRAVRITVNGVSVAGMGAYYPANATSENGCATPTRDVFLNVGDYVEVQGWQSTGAGHSTAVTGDLRCSLWVKWSHA